MPTPPNRPPERGAAGPRPGAPGGGRPATEAPGEEPQPGAPASVDQLRNLRRWVIVAGAWAVAASAIALIALFTDDGAAPGAVDVAPTAELAELSNRLDRVEGRVGSLASDADARSEEITRLSNRVDDIQGAVSEARSAAQEASEELATLSEDLATLEDRVQELESQEGE